MDAHEHWTPLGNLFSLSPPPSAPHSLDTNARDARWTLHTDSACKPTAQPLHRELPAYIERYGNRAVHAGPAAVGLTLRAPGHTEPAVAAACRAGDLSNYTLASWTLTFLLGRF